MIKKLNLTLIELLISMAIFSVMMTLLIKSFQLATDVSSNSESTIQTLEKSQLSLGLLSSELKQALSRSSMTWLMIPGPGSTLESKSFDKSLSFFIDIDEAGQDNESIRFFKPSPETDKIYVIQYKYNTSATGEKGLVRYEKELSNNFESNRSRSYNTIDNELADTNNLIAHIGLEDPNDLSSNYRVPPDLFANLNSDSSITADVIIPEEEISSISLSYTLDRYNYDTNDTGDDDDPTLRKGEKPDYITMSITLKDPKKAGSSRTFSRKISLNGN